MNRERENLDYTQLIEALRRLCREERTGTMFVCTEENQALRFVVEKGRVVGCAYRRKRGREAIPLIQEVKGGRYSFSEGMFMEEEVPMPDTPVLFQLLEKHRASGEEIDLEVLQRPPQPIPISAGPEGTPTKPEVSPPTPPSPAPFLEQRPEPLRQAPPPPAAPTSAKKFNIPSAEELQGLVENHLALLLGPIGPLIAAQYADAAGEIETDEQLLAFIDRIRTEIPDEGQSLAFRQGLLDEFR